MKAHMFRSSRLVAAIGLIALSLFSPFNTNCKGQAPDTSNAPAPSTSLPPGVDNLVKLTKAGLSEDIILTQVKGIGSVQLTTDQILYLNSVGVSQNVIKALLQNAPAPTAAAPAALAPVAAQNSGYPGAAPAAYPGAAPAGGNQGYAASQPAPTAPSYPGASNPPPPQEAPPPAAAPAPAAVTVLPNCQWIDTGVDLEQGQSVSINATGTITAQARVTVPFIGSQDFPAAFFQGPNGNPSHNTVNMQNPYLAPGLPGFGLVGTIGNSAPFFVGANATFAAPVAGRLFLAVNSNTAEGSAGQWDVAVNPAPAAPAAPPAQVSFDYFHDQLAPYGNWVQVPGYGWAWNPGVAAADPSWRPYADEGQWAYTDTGLYWQSNYPWGDIAFHYGRWAYNGGYGGWLWIPAYDWAPAWVAWRHAEAYGYTGWAPLPPSAVYVAGVGLMYNGVLAADIDFGMPADAFVFVGYDHFWDHGYRGYFLDRYRVRDFYGRSFVRNGYRFENGRFRVEGMGRDRLGAMTHRDVRAIDARDLRGREEKSHFESRRTDPAVRNGSRPDYRVGNLRAQSTTGYGRQPVPQARPGGARPVGAKPAAAPSSKKQTDDKKKN